MVRMRSGEYSEDEKATLKRVAKDALYAAVKERRRLLVGEHYPASLRLSGASFVTLTKRGRLRGCIGSLSAVKPLIEDVAANSYNAALCDPRFDAVDLSELGDISLSISVLTTPEEMDVATEEQLLREVNSGVDGLILQDGRARATYLPSVWEQLPVPVDFVRELKLKAQLPAGYWSDSMRWYRYQALLIK